MAKYSLTLNAETVRGIKKHGIPSRDISQVVAEYVAQQMPGNYSIDSVPADDGKSRVQNAWILYFNNRGEVFASAPDVVRAGYSNNARLLKSLREDFNKSCLITSIRFGYNPNDLVARMTHYFGSTVTVRKPVEHRLIVPVLQGEALYDVRDNKQVSAYLKAFTGLKGKNLMDSLEKLSDMPAEKIALWTPDQYGRKNSSERAAGFGYSGGMFHVGGYGWLGGYDVGRARRVLDVSAKPTAQKKAA